MYLFVLVACIVIYLGDLMYCIGLDCLRLHLWLFVLVFCSMLMCLSQVTELAYVYKHFKILSRRAMTRFVKCFHNGCEAIVTVDGYIIQNEVFLCEEHKK